MKRIEALQGRIIVGGENLLEKAEAQEKLLEQSAVELRRQEQRAEQLHQRLKQKEEERINVEEKYNTLQVRYNEHKYSHQLGWFHARGSLLTHDRALS